MSETQDVTLESLAWFDNCYLTRYLQHHQPQTFSPMRTAHESQHFQTAPFPSEQAMLSVLQLQLSLDSRSQPSFYSLVCFPSTLPSTLLQAKPHKAFVQRQSTSQHMRNPLNEVPSPGHVSLEPVPPWSVSLTLHIPTLYIWLVTGQDESKSFSWGHFSSSVLVLPWYCISRMLWDAPVLAQLYQTRQTDWKPQCLFENHLTTLAPMTNFGIEVNILSKYMETRREKCKLQMHHLSQIKSYHGTSVSFLKAVIAYLLRTAKTTTLLVKKNLVFS